VFVPSYLEIEEVDNDEEDDDDSNDDDCSPTFAWNVSINEAGFADAERTMAKLQIWSRPTVIAGWPWSVSEERRGTTS
jgi:hypothetical protein